MIVAHTTAQMRETPEDFNDFIASNSVTIRVGNDPNVVPPFVGWTDGVCYKPVMGGVFYGDVLEFAYEAHNVYQMASKKHFNDCNFTDAVLLSQVGESL